MGLGRKNINTDIKEAPTISKGSGVFDLEKTIQELKELKDWFDKDNRMDDYGTFYRAKSFVKSVFFSQLHIILMRSKEDLRENLQKFMKGEYEFGEVKRDSSMSPY